MRKTNMTRKEITDRFVAAIAQGNLPWRKPFARIAHQNPFSGTVYRGVNQLLLSLDMNASPHWGTYLQWKNAGCNVRKGAKASPIVFYGNVEKTNEEGEEVSFWLMRHYTVFHVGQVDDPMDKFKSIREMNIVTNFEIASRIIDNCGVDIRIGGNAAFYVPSENFIRVPHSSQFQSEEARLAVLFHEIGHWGDHTILERKPELDKKSPGYAFEELVAEIAACFLCQACGVPTDWDTHAGYITSWIQAMQNDPAYIFEASRDATKITDAILQRAGIKSEMEEEGTKQPENKPTVSSIYQGIRPKDVIYPTNRQYHWDYVDPRCYE